MIRLLFILATIIANGCHQPCDHVAPYSTCVYNPASLPVDWPLLDSGIEYVAEVTQIPADDLQASGTALLVEPADSGESLAYDVSERKTFGIVTFSLDSQTFFESVVVAYRLAIGAAYDKP